MKLFTQKVKSCADCPSCAKQTLTKPCCRAVQEMWRGLFLIYPALEKFPEPPVWCPLKTIDAVK